MWLCRRWNRGPMPVGGGGVKQHRSAGLGNPLAETRRNSQKQVSKRRPGSSRSGVRTNRTAAPVATARRRCIGHTTPRSPVFTALRLPFGASRCAHADRPTEPVRRRPDARTPPAKPSKEPSADATGRSRWGSCHAHRARAPPTWRANLRSAVGARNEPPRAGTARQHASPTPTTCRGVPIPRHEGPGRVSRPPEKSPSPFRLFGGFL